MKLRTKFLALGMGCSVLVVTALGVNLWGAQQRGEQMTQLRVITDITQRHMEVDMMHDAIRADVLASIVAANSHDAVAAAEARQSLDEHSKLLRDNLDLNSKENIPANIETSISAATTALQTYVDGGHGVMAAAEAGQDHTQASQDFATRFGEMETALSNISDQLSDWSKAVDDHAKARTKLFNDIGLLLSVFAIVGVLVMTFAQWLGILKPLSRLTHVIEVLAGGDDRIDVGFKDRSDEIGILAKAMDVLRSGLGESFLVSQMVKDMPAALMTVDVRDNMRISYVNPAMTRLGEALHIANTALTGQPVNAVCRDDSLQASFLSNPANLPCTRTVTIGEDTLDLTMSPVFDTHGAYQAVMIVWRPITDRMRLSRDFEQQVQSLVEAVAEGAAHLASSASGMRGGLQSSVRVAVTANEAAGQTASNVQTVAAAAEELSASVREISSQIQTTNTLVRESHARVLNADGLALKLAGASERVNEVTRVIASISGQINLLALNATIESARAGEAGRGFAVVANEVKTLANQTNRSIGEINGVIDEMRAASGEIITALAAIKESVESITQATTSVAAAVEEQSATTEDIAKNMAYAADGTRTISSNLQQVADETNSAEQTSSDLQGSSQSLSAQVTELRGQVGAFLARINLAA